MLGGVALFPDVPELTMLAANLGGGQEGMAPDSAAHLDIGWRPRPLTHVAQPDCGHLYGSIWPADAPPLPRSGTLEEEDETGL